MRKAGWFVRSVGLAMLVAFAVGCVSQGKYDKLLDHNRRLQAQLDDCNAEKGRLEADLKNLQDRYDRERAMAEKLSESLDKQRELMAELRREMEGIEGVEVAEGKVTVEDYVLFDSGKAIIKPAGASVLKKVAHVLSSRDVSVRIDGHTDSDPIKYSGWKSNHELAAARAHAVFESLLKGGVPEKKMVLVAWGPNKPRATNDTPEGKQLNRRVEIYVLQGEVVAPGGTPAAKPARKPARSKAAPAAKPAPKKKAAPETEEAPKVPKKIKT